MRHYQVVLACPKTKEIKIINKNQHSFARVVSFSFIETRRLLESTGETWLVSAIYDMAFKFDAKKPLT
tara:strand:+ start:895 stop:1098 length:204 start_codon:yes stop_codon:yes gene_type:complete